MNIFSGFALLSSVLLSNLVLASEPSIVEEPKVKSVMFDIVKVDPNENKNFSPMQMLRARVAYYVDNIDQYAADYTTNGDQLKTQTKPNKSYPSYIRFNVRGKIDNLTKLYGAAKSFYSIVPEKEEPKEESLKAFKKIIDWVVQGCGTTVDDDGSISRQSIITRHLENIVRKKSRGLNDHVFRKLNEKYLSKLKNDEPLHSRNISNILSDLNDNNLDKVIKHFVAQEQKLEEQKKENSNSSSSESSSSFSSSSSSSVTKDQNLGDDEKSGNDLEKDHKVKEEAKIAINDGSKKSSANDDKKVNEIKEADRNGQSGDKDKNDDSKNSSLNNNNQQTSFWTPLSVTLVSVAGLAIVAITVVLIIKFYGKKEEDAIVEAADKV